MSVKALYKEIRFTLRDLIYNSRCRKKLLNNDFSLITWIARAAVLRKT